MRIEGSGITPFYLRVANDYDVNTTLAMKWMECEDGNWYASDRGANADYYETVITTYGKETYINNILEQLDNNRNNANYVILMSEFSSDEHIFGEDLAYTTVISGTVISYSERTQNSLNGFKQELGIRCISPSFTGVAVLPTWSDSCIAIGYDNQQVYKSNKYDTYYGDYTYYDHRDDHGIINFTLNLTNEELRDLRTWLRTNRDSTFNLTSLNGIDTVIPNITFPQDMKILNVDEISRFNINRWIVKVQMVTHII